ncbi:MAG TPA: hypothetical protein VGP94_07720, partial [Tepidisphaeraceae bacterium]|nr:hypothetical protein [Tepidisphaeraceae bacterium]
MNTDIDSNNDGIPDGPIFAMWTILDSVGILDNDGTGDIAYSAINFRRNPNATASGTIVAVPSFTPSYVARNYNSTGSAAADWVAADSFAGSVPNWVLGNNTVPSGRAHAPLNHIGTTNFGTLPPVVLSELKVNAPGPDDGPYEFIELRGPPNLSLANLWVVAVEGNSSANRGRASMVVDLGASSLGSDGVLIIAAPGNPYTIPAATSVILDSQLANTSGALGNGTISFLLISSTSAISEGADLDGGDNGTLEGLPTGALIVDAVGWSDHDSGDIVYGGVDISQSGFTPDAATRFGSDNTPFSAAAWFSGDLSGGASSLTYNESEVSANFPSGTTLTPGGGNNSVPLISPLQPICGVIGDPTNPQIEFLVGDADTPPGSLTITATSTNPAVVPDSNLLINGSGGTRILTINPIGVGYSQIIITVSDGITTVRRSFPYAASEMGRPGGHFHIGGSDGSTAIAVDANYMFVGDDENQTIRLYHRFRSGLPVWKMDFNPFLGLTDYENGVPREVDIESSTRVGNRIYWMGGHSHANIGEGRTNRTRIFATDISGTGAASTLSYVGRYENLKADLVNWDENNHHGKGANYYGFAASTAEGVEPKAPNGFNIEGLSMMPGSSVGAYIGFRAPIVPVTNRVYALVLPILNFTTMATNSGVPNSSSFGAPIEMDLGGRGVRSIEGVTGNYLIIGGPPGDINPDMPPPRDFKLYTWTGNPADPPQERAADLSGLNPEGIVELPPLPWTDTTQVQLLSDNGRMVYYGDDVTAKHLPITNFKKCRSDMVTLGAVVTPRPTILSITPSGANMM